MKLSVTERFERLMELQRFAEEMRRAKLASSARSGYFGDMTIEAIKEAIAGLPEDDRVSLTAWLNLQVMDDWDQQMQRDFSPGGRGHHLVDKVKAEIRSGKFQPMSKGRPRRDR